MRTQPSHDTYARRRERFLGTSHSATLSSEQHLVSNDPAVLAALPVVRASLEAHALQRGIPRIDDHDMGRMLSAAQYLLTRLPRNQIEGLSASSLLNAITLQSFAAATTSDPRTLSSQAIAAQHISGAHSFDGSGMIGLMRIRDGERASSRLGGTAAGSYSELGGDQFTSHQLITIAAARTEAGRYGLTAIPPRDLLAIGPAGVKAIAAVQLDNRAYTRLRGEARFEPRHVVTFAEYARTRGITDAKPAADAVADLVRRGSDEADKLRLRNAIVGYMTAATAAARNPSDAAAQQRLQQSIENYRTTMAPIAARSEEDRRAVQRAEDRLRIEQAARVTAGGLDTKATAKDAAVDAGWDNLASDIGATAKTQPPVNADGAAKSVGAKEPEPAKNSAVTTKSTAAPATAKAAAAPAPAAK